MYRTPLPSVKVGVYTKKIVVIDKKASSLQLKYKQVLVTGKKDGYMAYLLTQQTSVIEQNSSSQDGKKEDRNEEVTEVSMKLCLVFVCQDVILWSLSMKDINYNYFFSINAGAIEWSTLKISTCYLGRLGKPATNHFSE